jgi:hypothetical protein
MFFKKEKIVFHCELPEIKEKYPIIAAKEYKFNWFKKSAQAFKSTVEQRAAYEQITGVVKCPGIHPVMKKGYIVQSWFDITVKPLINGFEFFIPQGLHSYLKERKYDKHLVSCFSGEHPAHAIPLPETYVQALIKINLPWSVSIPAGWNLLIMPIPYSDNTDFTAVHGMLEPGDFYNLNAIIKCNSNNKQFTIPAGTPLMQIIPIKDNSPIVEFADYDERTQQKEINNKYISNHQFVIKK